MAPTRAKPEPPRVGYSQRSRLDKLGVKPGMRVALIGLDDAAFRRELRTRTADIAEGRPTKDTDMILFAVDGPAPLERLAALQRALKPNGAIWVVWPKGQPHIKEDMIRGAALANGLVDIKVMAFSETLSGLKLVIPLAKRPESPARKEVTIKSKPKRPVVMPIELKRALAASPKAKAEFERFPPSHQREVIGYIIEAKKPETRERRAAKTMDELEKGWPRR